MRPTHFSHRECAIHSSAIDEHVDVPWRANVATVSAMSTSLFCVNYFNIFRQAIRCGSLKLSTPYALQGWQNRPWMQRVAEVILIPITAQRWGAGILDSVLRVG